jgi:hypothetical protein
VSEDLPDWERLLAAERHLQALVPGSVLVGGTAAAIHASHRQSLDGIMSSSICGSDSMKSWRVSKRLRGGRRSGFNGQ